MTIGELTLADLLADPMIRAVMAADRIDPLALEAALHALASKLRHPRPADREPAFAGDHRPW